MPEHFLSYHKSLPILFLKEDGGIFQVTALTDRMQMALNILDWLA